MKPLHITLLAITCTLFGIVVGGLLLWSAVVTITMRSIPPSPVTTSTEDTPVRGCTKELKICPDGTGVGRSGPNCEFAACPSAGMVACTMEAMLCPDGVTYVGRTGPNCEFTPCP